MEPEWPKQVRKYRVRQKSEFYVTVEADSLENALIKAAKLPLDDWEHIKTNYDVDPGPAEITCPKYHRMNEAYI